MTPLAKKLLVVLAGVVAMTVAMVLTIWVMGGRGAAQRDGISLVFEITDSKGDLATEMKALRVRLAGVPGAIVSKAGGGKLAVWIPYAQALRQGWTKRQTALEEFRKTQLSPARLDALLKVDAALQMAEMTRVAPAGSALYETLPQLIAASDQLAAARKAAVGSKTRTAATGTTPATRQRTGTDDMDAVEQAARALDAAWARVYANTLDVAKLSRMLKAADEPGDAAAARRRNELVVQYPAQATEIRQVIEAHDAWVAAGGRRQAGPEDVERNLLAEDGLEFRMAVEAGDLAQAAANEYRQAIGSLQDHGPNAPVRCKAGDLHWYELDPEAGDWPGGPYVTGYGQGRQYLLCYDDRAHRLTYRDPHDKPWPVQAGEVSVDAAKGLVTLPFKLDAAQAKLLAELTQKNLGRALVVLFDRRVLCAPVLRSALADAGAITFGGGGGGGSAAGRLRKAQEIRVLMGLPPLPWPLRRVQ